MSLPNGVTPAPRPAPDPAAIPAPPPRAPEADPPAAEVAKAPAAAPAAEAAEEPVTAETETATGAGPEAASPGAEDVVAGAASEAPELAPPDPAEAASAAIPDQTELAQDAAVNADATAEEPEVVAGPSPEEAVAPAAAAMGRRSSAASTHQPPEAATDNAIQSSNVPAVGQAREAERAGITATDDTETGEINVAEFRKELKNALDAAVPPPRSESQAERQVERGAVDAAAPLQTALSDQTTTAAGDLPATAAAEPDPAQITPVEPVPLEPEAVGEAPAPVSAGPVVPPPTPAVALDTSANEERVDALAAEHNITQEQLQRGNDPQFDAALGARSEAQAHDEAAPAAYYEGEAATRGATRARAANRIGTGLTDIQTTRAEQFNNVAQTQADTSKVTAERKAEITQEIEAIGLATREDVTTILTEMQEGAADKFNKAIASAQKRFDEIMEDAVGGGWFSAIFGNWFDNSDEYNAALIDATDEYDAIVDEGIGEVATFVVQELQRAKDRVAEGRQEIDTYINETLTDDERQFGEDASTSITADFDTLEGEIESSRGAVVSAMVDIYRVALEEREKSAAEFRERSKSVWQRVYDATVGLVQKVLEFKNMLLGILSRAVAVVEAIIQDPIGFLSNLIAGIGAGLQRFVDNIAENLKQALMGWLFGALEGAGLKLPDKFDLMGFLDIVLQVLGLTKENIRARAVKILGEETVAKIEMAVDFLKTLFTEGPAAIWEMLLEQLGNIKDAIIEEIKSWVITKIVIAGIKWIVGLLNPASAFVKACMMIYDIVMFFIQRGQQIISAVNAIVNALGTIVAGNISAMAEAVEGALNRILPVVIGFLASLLGLGGISEQIRKIIEAIQAPVNKAIDWVINLGLGIARKIGALFGGSPEAEEEQVEEDPDDPEKEMQITAAFDDLYEAEERLAGDGGLSAEEAQSVADQVVQRHAVIKSMRIVRGDGHWIYHYTSSPEKSRASRQEIDIDGVSYIVVTGPNGRVRVSATDDEEEVSFSGRATSARKIEELMNGLEVEQWVAEKIVSQLAPSDLDMAYNLLLQFSRQEGELPPDEYIVQNLERNLATSAAVSTPPRRATRARLVNLGEEDIGGPAREPLSEYALVFRGERGQWTSRPHPPTNSIEYIYQGIGMAPVTALGAIRVNDDGEVVEILQVSPNVVGGRAKLISWMKAAGWTVKI